MTNKNTSILNYLYTTIHYIRFGVKYSDTKCPYVVIPASYLADLYLVSQTNKKYKQKHVINIIFTKKTEKISVLISFNIPIQFKLFTKCIVFPVATICCLTFIILYHKNYNVSLFK